MRAKPVVVAANKVDLMEAGPVGRSRRKSDTAAMLRYLQTRLSYNYSFY